MAILNVWNYAMSVLSAFLALGVGCYLLDRKYGISVYRWWYNLTRSQPMPESISLGFLYGQSTNRKVTVATVLASAFSVYLLWQHKFDLLTINFLVELIVWVAEIPSMMLGFYLGSFIWQLLLHRSEYFDKLDTLSETGVSAPVEQVTRAAGGVVGRVATFFTSIPGKIYNMIFPPPVSIFPPQAPPSADASNEEKRRV